MVSSCLLDTCFSSSIVTLRTSNNICTESSQANRSSQHLLFRRKEQSVSVNASSDNHLHHLPSSSACKQQGFVHKSLVPLAASTLLLCSTPAAYAGLLSGSTGIESVPGPDLPKIEFLNKFNEENQKRYAENDARFKDSPVLKQLLERSKLNKEKNKQAIQDKYCIRGAEWGVGDCSTDGMKPDEKDAFIAMLKKKAGVE